MNFSKGGKPAYRLKIDFSEMDIKPLSAQITKHSTKEQLIGQQVMAVVNFPPKQIGSFYGECLLPGVYDENNDVILFQPERTVNNGLKIG
jgi:tRNA-binding protein